MKTVLACPHFPACSGCSAIGVAYAEQLARKLRTVGELFAEANLDNFDPTSIRTITPSPTPGAYRNRVKLVPARGSGANGALNAAEARTRPLVGHSTSGEIGPRRGGRATRNDDAARDRGVKENVRLGLYREGSHEVVDIAGCPVQTEGVNRVIEVIRDALGLFNVPFYDEATHTGELRFVTVRQSVRTAQVLIGFVTRTDDCPGIGEIGEHLMRRCPGTVGVAHNVNTEKGNAIFGRTTRLLAGRPFLEEIVCGVRLYLGVTSFFQVNTAVAEKAYEAIMAHLHPGHEDVLLDLYSGAGAIGLAAARAVGQVIGIEEAGEAIELATAAARANRIPNAVFHEGLVEDRLPQLMTDLRRRGFTPERLAVVANPPRKGLDRRVIEQLVEASPGRLAYLSCAPVTLLRDLGRLAKGGYRVRHVELFDMFPQTGQVETLSILEAGEEDGDRPLRRGGRRTDGAVDTGSVTE